VARLKGASTLSGGGYPLAFHNITDQKGEATRFGLAYSAGSAHFFWHLRVLRHRNFARVRVQALRKFDSVCLLSPGILAAQIRALSSGFFRIDRRGCASAPEMDTPARPVRRVTAHNPEPELISELGWLPFCPEAPPHLLRVSRSSFESSASPRSQTVDLKR